MGKGRKGRQVLEDMKEVVTRQAGRKERGVAGDKLRENQEGSWKLDDE